MLQAESRTERKAESGCLIVFHVLFGAAGDNFGRQRSAVQAGCPKEDFKMLQVARRKGLLQLLHGFF